MIVPPSLTVITRILHECSAGAQDVSYHSFIQAFAHPFQEFVILPEGKSAFPVGAVKTPSPLIDRGSAAGTGPDLLPSFLCPESVLLEIELITVVLAGILIPAARVSVANTTFISPF